MLKRRVIDGLDYVVVPEGHVIYKAMGKLGMTTEKMNEYLDSKGSPSISWFGELSNAKWYMKNWFENKGQIYQYEFLKEGVFLNMSKATIKILLNRFKKNKAFVSQLKCFSGVELSQLEQFKKCAQKNIDDYPSKLRVSRLSSKQDDELTREDGLRGVADFPVGIRDLFRKRVVESVGHQQKTNGPASRSNRSRVGSRVGSWVQPPVQPKI